MTDWLRGMSGDGMSRSGFIVSNTMVLADVCSCDQPPKEKVSKKKVAAGVHI